SAPIFNPEILSELRDFAVNMMITTSSSFLSSRTQSQTSSPVTFGSIKSSISKLGSYLSYCALATSPSSASITSYPSYSKYTLIKSRIMASSSTIKIGCCKTPPLLYQFNPFRQTLEPWNHNSTALLLYYQ